MISDRGHLSIGEVLALLREEFPDITISKIRFLESQGLLDPERTPSGYRKFYEPDIERLRWILRQQKNNFLPLKVIRDRLEAEPVGAPSDPIEEPPAPLVAEPEPVEAPAAVVPVPAPVAAPEPAPAPAAVVPAPQAVAPAPRPEPRPPSGGLLDAGPTAVSLTGAELLTATGITDRDLADLEKFGLVKGRAMGRETIYDEDALVIARLAGEFKRFGVEARHLRMYKVSADREAAFLEQVVVPLLKQRNPTARRQAVTNVGELTELGDSLRAAMLRQALRGVTG